tara:strand:- start:26 stop:208 length:183 start_codon:yes stop_codon:yes gene_type:complete
MKTKPIIYKFTFYGCVHPLNNEEKTQKDLESELEDLIWCHESLQVLTPLKITKHKLVKEE